jgi:putative DNA primase/helicase
MSAEVDPLKTAASADEVRVELSEDALALVFTQGHREELLYVHLWGQWLKWDGCRWRPEHTLAVYDLARDLVRESARAAHTEAQRKSLASAKTVAAVVTLARSDRAHAKLPDEFDRHPLLLNTPAGTVDLLSGLLRPPAKADRITKITPVSPSGSCPLWLSCLKTWTCDDDELASFLQRVVGYFLRARSKRRLC